MIDELIDRRVLAAVGFRDAVTGRQVSRQLRVEADDVSWIRNRKGRYIVASAPGLDAHIASFKAPPDSPPVGSQTIVIRVQDPRGEYVSRQAVLTLPRLADPRRATEPLSLFQIASFELFPAAAARTERGWAVVRASVTRTATGAPVAGALLRAVATADDRLLGRGLADTRGEVLLAISGIPITTWDEGNGDGPSPGPPGDPPTEPVLGPVLTDEVEAAVQLVVDPTVTDLADPDDMERRRNELSVPATLRVFPDVEFSSTEDAVLRLASGRELAVEVRI